jgi:riboflavin synthase alpha subunit
MFQEDLSVLFADFGVIAYTVSGAAQVLMDMPGQQILHDMQISNDYAITYLSYGLPGLKYGDPITVNGITYTVREITALDDGALTHATLSK